MLCLNNHRFHACSEQRTINLGKLLLELFERSSVGLNFRDKRPVDHGLVKWFEVIFKLQYIAKFLNCHVRLIGTRERYFLPSPNSSENTSFSWLGLVTVKLKVLFQSQIDKTRGRPGLKARSRPLIEANGKHCSSQTSLRWMSRCFV